MAQRLSTEALAVFASPEMEFGLAVLAEDAREESRRFIDRCEQIDALARLVPRHRGDETGATAWTSFLEDVAMARRWSRPATVGRVRQARLLVRCFPQTADLLRSGAMPVVAAEKLVGECDGLDDELSREVDRRLAQSATSWTPTRVVQEVRRLLLALDAEAAAQRAEKAAAGRSVDLVPLQDGQAGVWLSGPAEAVTAWYARVDAEARARRQAGDGRTLDQLRFDLATGHSQPTQVRLDVQVTVDTLLGLSDEPGWLDGYGWISAPQTREWVPVATLRQVCTSREGRVVDVADRAVRPPPERAREALQRMASEPMAITEKTWRVEPRHDPSPALDEFVRMRDRFADSPTGGPTSAARADLDHDLPYGDGGPTAASNLRARTRRAHGLKHAGWQASRLPDGTTLWISPSGRCRRTD